MLGVGVTDDIVLPIPNNRCSPVKVQATMVIGENPVHGCTWMLATVRSRWCRSNVDGGLGLLLPPEIDLESPQWLRVRATI